MHREGTAISTTLAVRFPLRRYHATSWDHGVNEGIVEWPPSPWRLLRALVATWYTRWPELPAPVLDATLDALGDPPSYRTSAVWPAHTRHYLPDPNRKSGETGDTDLTLDPFLALPPSEDHLLIRWDAQLTDEQREVLGKLVELVPYLGRADSICEMRLLHDECESDETWWQPGATGEENARLLAPIRPIRRAVLELSTVAIRKERRIVPAETQWVRYARTPPPRPASAPTRQAIRAVTALRFAADSAAPVKSTRGVLLADRLHEIVAYRMDGGRPELFGHSGAATDHSHAHWMPLPTGWSRGAGVESIVVWVPSGLRQEEVATLIGVRTVTDRGRDDGSKRFPDTRLLLQAVGTIKQVAPELHGPARVWRSLTPYLPVRHPKRHMTLDDFITADVRQELAYRGRDSEVVVSRTKPDETLSDGWSLEFRRYRLREKLKDARRGLGLRLTFAEEITGPLAIGQLSHFGYGIFIPEPFSP